MAFQESMEAFIHTWTRSLDQEWTQKVRQTTTPQLTTISSIFDKLSHLSMKGPTRPYQLCLGCHEIKTKSNYTHAYIFSFIVVMWIVINNQKKNKITTTKTRHIIYLRGRERSFFPYSTATLTACVNNSIAYIAHAVLDFMCWTAEV